MHWSRSDERIVAVRRRLGDGPWARQQLLAAGWSARQIERDLQQGRLERVIRGVYAPTGVVLAWDAPQTYAPPILGAGDDAAVSFESAAAIRRMWIPYPADPRIHLSSSGRPVTYDPVVRRHRTHLRDDDVDVLAGVRVTSVARTAVDLARGKAFAQALAPLDSATRILALGEAAHSAAGRVLLARPGARRRVDAALGELRAAAGRIAGGRGTRELVRCLEQVDPRSESPYESWCRGELVSAGVRIEALGLEVRGASGRLYYADFAWPSLRLIAEADGVEKYGSDLRTVRERVMAERHRQRDLEDAGWEFVRWTAGEPALVFTARVARALAAATARSA
ncbi:type IV toxin-antitoxin system AbiEi family antitoxin domain-containing protein [Longivirga aurantiaca]|uniref:Type IV toxin-antitoxin system AbiEi family antitoxin domain-containing protein n=1 Tax=Longivirga aurantiaca TaxID=1837743 RepID=A0ABW1SWB5_9ACTN